MAWGGGSAVGAEVPLRQPESATPRGSMRWEHVCSARSVCRARAMERNNTAYCPQGAPR